jgi:primosomal protein N' (replication factor Y)
MAGKKYLDIVFNLNIPGSLQYLCPPRLAGRAVPGMRALAPLNRRTQPGVIISTGTEAKVDRVLSISGIPDEEAVLTTEMLELMRWLSKHYLATPGMSLKAVLPSEILRRGYLEPDPGNRRLSAAMAGKADAPAIAGLTLRQQRVVSILAGEGRIPAAELVRKAAVDYRTLHSLERRGFLTLTPEEIPEESLPVVEGDVPEVVLTHPQKEAVRVMSDALSARAFQRIILRGPPASGKMEAALNALAEALPGDLQALILVPELTLAPPLISRVEHLFPGQVAIIHGRLSPAQRRRVWLRCRRGEARVVVGSRSAAFAPLPGLGAIIVDEEHEPAYKSEESPRYHARETALQRCRLTGAPVILASATPSMEVLALRDAGDTLDLELPPVPALRGRVKMIAVDLREERLKGGEIISGRLRAAIKRTLSRKGRSILFVNRRGVASALFCRDCYYTPGCPRCSTVLAYHGEAGQMACRVCGHREMIFSACPRCGGSLLKPGSPGTLGVEKEVLSVFPKARTRRMDRDTVSGKGHLEKIFRDFAGGGIDVLVGTQILARGLHWPKVSLVGIVDADISLQRADFRSAERTFQLITQAAGRAARGLTRGEAIIQTHHPEHYAVQAVLRDDPEIFYGQETLLRSEVGFPPFSRLILLVVEDRDQEALLRNAGLLRKGLDRALAGEAPSEEVGVVEILGPHTAPRSRQRGRHRLQILLKGPDPDLLRRVVRETVAASGLYQGRNRGKIQVDVDPYDFL